MVLVAAVVDLVAPSLESTHEGSGTECDGLAHAIGASRQSRKERFVEVFLLLRLASASFEAASGHRQGR